MKLINKLDETMEKSLYSGQATRSNEIYLRPVPKCDENGKELKKSERYYVFRLLYFTTEDRNYPFIVRDEHTFLKKDASGNVKEVKRICCPNTLWARDKIQEKVDKDYCPICKFSEEQKQNGWKNWRTLGQRDDTCLRIHRESRRQWAAYLPVLVISDPIYKSNNNHFKILRLSGDEGMSAYKRIKEKIFEANKAGISVFNGENGANIAMLCEKVQKVATDKNGETILDRTTGEPRTYAINSVTDVQLLSKRLHSYDVVTEANLTKLAFDETYGAAATKDQLQAFLSENYLDNGASDSDFDELSADDDEFGGEEEKPAATESKAVAGTASSSDFDDEEDDESEAETETPSDDENTDDDDFANESPRDAIARITKGKVQTSSAASSKKVVDAVMGNTPQKKPSIKMKARAEFPKDTEAIRDDSLDIDPDDLPF